MNAFWRVVALMGVVFVVSPALAAEEPVEIIRKAITAHGGADVLNRYPAGVIKSEGSINTGEAEYRFVATNRYQLPDRGRNEIEILLVEADPKNKIKEERVLIAQLFQGEKVQVLINGKDRPLTDEETADLRYGLYIQQLYQLTPLALKDGPYTLKLLDDAPKVGDDETTGIEVTARNRKDVKLYFSKKTGLLVQLERKGTNPKGKEVTQVQTLSGHKTFNGIVRPTKVVVTNDGKPFTDVTLDYKHFEKLPESELAPPK